jgi:CO/xanthine dehydrogenase FAD-binding subunit
MLWSVWSVLRATMKFEVVNPNSLHETLDVLASVDNVVPLAGGTDLMVYLEAGSLGPCTFLNLQDIAQLRPKLFLDRSVTLGALTTYRDVRLSPIRDDFPMLAFAAREVGSLAVQSRGTWAGNIANASPAADGVPALMAYDAEVELTSNRASRRVSLCKFYRGYKQMDRKTNELITAIHLPRPQAGWFDYYRKVGARRFQAISKTLLAGRILFDAGNTIRDIRMILASVAPYTFRAFETERVLRGSQLGPKQIESAAAAIQDEIHPIDDIRSTEMYRRRVTSNLVRDFLTRAIDGRQKYIH